MASLDELLSAEPDLDDVTETVNVMLGGQLVDFRFTKLDGDRWAELCGKHLPRPMNALDQIFQCNVDMVVNDAVKINGVRVDAGTVEAPSDGQWNMILSALSGADVKKIRDAIWWLNQIGPEQRLEAAKKALSTAGNDTSSPSDSE